MGKVKAAIYCCEQNEYVNKILVSIPYGKGKEQHFALRFYYNP